MANLIEIQNTLNSFGFVLPASKDALVPSEVFNRSSLIGFQQVETGGGCNALRRDAGGIYILLTDEDGCDVPNEQDWAENLIGIYRVSTDPSADDEEIFCMSARELLDLIKSSPQPAVEPDA